MERYAWSARVKDGYKEEYIKRHNNIWPEMKKLLKDAGICNYTIFAQDNKLFGYYECEYGVEFASKTQSSSEIVKKWDEYMSDILIWDKPIGGAQPKMVEVFRLD